jgi:CheY-like chemotaxis protein
MQEKKPKIVMFEDDSMLSGMFKLNFERGGFEVKAFAHPPENLVEVVAEEAPDLIFMNIIMPKMDGFQATKLLKSDARTKDIPLTFATNLEQREDIQKGLDLGAIEYIVYSQTAPQEIVDLYKKILAGGYKTMWTKEKLDKLSAESIKLNKVRAIEPEKKIKSDSENFLKYAGWAFVGIVVIGLLLVIFAI